jgi:hypothetical protein
MGMASANTASRNPTLRNSPAWLAGDTAEVEQEKAQDARKQIDEERP